MLNPGFTVEIGGDSGSPFISANNERSITMRTLLVVFVVGLSCTAAWADITIGHYAGGGSVHGVGIATGYFFTPNVDIIVTRLGVYDHGAPGLAARSKIVCADS